jgi:hypothetical protein
MSVKVLNFSGQSLEMDSPPGEGFTFSETLFLWNLSVIHFIFINLADSKIKSNPGNK